MSSSSDTRRLPVAPQRGGVHDQIPLPQLRGRPLEQTRLLLRRSGRAPWLTQPSASTRPRRSGQPGVISQLVGNPCQQGIQNCRTGGLRRSGDRRCDHARMGEDLIQQRAQPCPVRTIAVRGARPRVSQICEFRRPLSTDRIQSQLATGRRQQAAEHADRRIHLRPLDAVDRRCRDLRAFSEGALRQPGAFTRRTEESSRVGHYLASIYATR